MSTQKILLTVLGALLLMILAFMFLLRPQIQEIEAVGQEIDDSRQRQEELRAQIARLEDVRARSPSIEALVTAADMVVPRDDPSLPSAVRQLQMAANDSGAELVSVAMSRPESTEFTNDVTVPEDMATIGTTVTVSGGYYQLVDFLRRVEDPVLSPRAVLWSQANIVVDEYPTLTMNLTGAMFAYLEDIGAEDSGTEPDDEGTDPESPTDEAEPTGDATPTEEDAT